MEQGMTQHQNESSGSPRMLAPQPIWASLVLIHHNSRKTQMVVTASCEVIYPLFLTPKGRHEWKKTVKPPGHASTRTSA